MVGDDYVTLNLALHNTVEESRVEQEITCQKCFNSFTVFELKNQIELTCSIPQCFQALYFESTLLRDEDTLAQCWLRKGDTVTVKYRSTADVQSVVEMVTLLSELVPSSSNNRDLHVPDRDLHVPDRDLPVSTLQRIRQLAFSCFRDTTLRCDANRLVFVHKGGVSILYKLYSIVLEKDYLDASFHWRYLESVVVQVLGSALIDSCTRVPLLKEHVLENPTLDYVLKSFTRVMIPQGEKVVAPLHPFRPFPVPADVQNLMLAHSLQMSQVNTSK